MSPNKVNSESNDLFSVSYSPEAMQEDKKEWNSVYRKLGRAVTLSPHAFESKFHGGTTRDAWYIESDNKYTGSTKKAGDTALRILKEANKKGREAYIDFELLTL